MVPDLTRRKLLAGSSAVVGTGLIGTGLLAPEWLPDRATDHLLDVYSDPPARVWWPEIVDAHADDAVEHLEAAVERANDLKERIDVDALPDDLAFELDRDPSGGRLESAKSEPDPWERLFSATYGLQFAGETIGYAKVALDEGDPEMLVERGARIRSEAETVRDSLRDYPVSEPRRDLDFLYAVERELGLARLHSYSSGTYTGGVADADEYTDRTVASTWGAHLQAQQRLRNARYYRDLYRERLSPDPRPYADALDGAVARLADAIEAFPTRPELRTEIGDDLDLTRETPYGAARWELWTLCYDNDFRAGYGPDGYQSGHTVQRVVELARALLARRAHEFALSELDVSPDDADYDSGRAFRAKRRAVRTFRSVRDEFGSPFAGLVAQSAADRIRAGDVGIGSTGRRDDRPAWADRVEAATYYLVATGQLRDLGDVLGAIFGGSQ
ncbi:transcriptional initiation protein Tat [Halobacteriales archaeon QS_1_67_19]|nr:MAG: transcriptional initiation protein Tat [Halobacteriales archaeon QS_1_67_19]